MKKIFLLLLIFTITLNAQQGLFVFHPVSINQSKLSEFETIQLEYSKKLAQSNVAVSYTHLTLPTNREV